MSKSDTYILTECSRCEQSWVPPEGVDFSQDQVGVRPRLSQRDIRCPHCKQDHRVVDLPIIERHHDRDALLEIRSRKLAADAECREEYETQGRYVEQAEQAEAYLADVENQEWTEEAATEVAGTVGVDDGIETWADAVAGTVGVDDDLEERAEATAGTVGFDDELETWADAVAGTVGAEETAEAAEQATDEGGEIDDSTGARPGDTVDNTGSLQFRQDVSTHAHATVTDIKSATDLHDSLFAVDSEMQQQVVEAAYDLVERVDRDPGGFWELMERCEDSDRSLAFAGMFETEIRELIGRSSTGQPEARLAVLMSQLGGNNPWDLRPGLEDIYEGPMKILRASTKTPTVVVQIPTDIFDVDRMTRDRLIEYLTELARGCDVNIVATAQTQRRLILDYEFELPTSVIESTIARCDTDRVTDDPEGVVDAVVPAEISPGDTEFDVLRLIAEGRTDMAHYGTNSELANDARLSVGRSRISTAVATLSEHGLVNQHGEKDPYAVVTAAGKEALARVRQQYGDQSTLEDAGEWDDGDGVSESPNAYADTCCHAQGREGGEGEDTTATAGCSTAEEAAADDCTEPEHSRNHSQGIAPVEYLSQWEHHAAVSIAPDGGVGLDNVPVSSVNRDEQWSPREDHNLPEWTVTENEDNRSPIYSYRGDKDELVVGAEYHTDMQLGVSMARALLCPKAFEQILTPDRLDGASGDLDALLDGNKPILRDKSCLGWLKSGYDGESYREALIEGREDLLELTRRHKYGDHDEEQFKELCRDIMRLSHGLIGTATMIYDLLGVDVHRTIRIPGSVSGNLDKGVPGESHTSASVTGLCEWIVRAATISSKFGAYTQSRVQLEPRLDKRKATGSAPTVSTDDMQGEHIGSWSIVGHGVDALQEPLVDAFENPEDYNLQHQTDAPNYVGWIVDIPIKTGFDRVAAHRVTTRMLEDRDLRLTRHAVSLMQAFCGSPHDAAKGLYYLSSEDGRRVRVDELRRSLSLLPPNRILPTKGNTSTKSQVAHALIEADEPLSQAELCRRAGVTETSFAGWGSTTSHREEMEAFGLIRQTVDGWVICLPYDADIDVSADPAADPDAPVTGLPWYAIVDDEAHYSDRKRPAGRREESLQGVIYDAVVELEDVEDLSDTNHPVCGKLYGTLTVEDLRDLMAHRQSWALLIEFVTAIREADPAALRTPTDDRDPVQLRGRTETATLGRPPEQAGVASATSGISAPTAD